jgi:hypothetical protein
MASSSVGCVEKAGWLDMALGPVVVGSIGLLKAEQSPLRLQKIVVFDAGIKVP